MPTEPKTPAIPAPPLAEMLPADMIIGWDIPEDGPEPHLARALQACACGLSSIEAAALFDPPLTVEQITGAKKRYRALYEVYKARNEVIFRSMARSSLFASLAKIAHAASQLDSPHGWEEMRTAMQVAQGMHNLMDAFKDRPIGTARARADVSKALTRLQSLQAATVAQDAETTPNNGAQVEIDATPADNDATPSASYPSA